MRDASQAASAFTPQERTSVPYSIVRSVQSVRTYQEAAEASSWIVEGNPLGASVPRCFRTLSTSSVSRIVRYRPW